MHFDQHSKCAVAFRLAPNLEVRFFFLGTLPRLVMPNRNLATNVVVVTWTCCRRSVLVDVAHGILKSTGWASYGKMKGKHL